MDSSTIGRILSFDWISVRILFLTVDLEKIGRFSFGTIGIEMRFERWHLVVSDC